MDKVIVDTDVIHGIISAYRRADSSQDRVYGIILGSKKDHIYHITEVLYGFIFETKNPKTNQKELVKMNDEILNSLINSLTQKFKMNSSNATSNKNKNETEIKFRNNDTLMILGGFVTDKEPFTDLYRLHNTLDKISNKTFHNLNEILLLINPNHKDENFINFGIKAYHWDTKIIKIKGLEKSNAFIIFKQIKTEVVKELNNYDLISSNYNQNLWENLYKLKIDKNETKNVHELLLNENKNDNKPDRENNNEFIIKKIKGAIEYLNLFEQILENLDDKGKDLVNGDDYNLIASKVAELEQVLSDEEIIKVINNDVNYKYNVDSLSQLLDVQLNLSDKIRELIK